MKLPDRLQTPLSMTVQAELDKYSYKPGWYCTVWGTEENIRISLFGQVQNLSGHGTTELSSSIDWNPYVVREMGAAETARITINTLIKQLEEHERNEWLLYDGEFVNHPHPEIEDYLGVKRHLARPEHFASFL